MPPPQPLAVFDLDGTLVDTAPDLVDACDEVLRARGLGRATLPVLRPAIGISARAIVERGLEANGRRLAAAEVGEVLAAFLTEYENRIARLSRPFPEMLAALDLLEASGVALAVCTNKRERMARDLLTALHLMPRLVALTGGDTYGVLKPDPLPLVKTIAAAGGAVARTVYVGDSRVDRLTAQAASVAMVGITYGYSDVPMQTLSPDRLCGPGDDVGRAVLDLLAHAPERAAPPTG